MPLVILISKYSTYSLLLSIIVFLLVGDPNNLISTKGTMGDQQQPQGMSIGDSLKLPPGFRFHPRDEEIITFYLTPKVFQRGFTCIAIGEVDLNRTEPWELPGTYTLCTNAPWLVHGIMDASL